MFIGVVYWKMSCSLIHIFWIFNSHHHKNMDHHIWWENKLNNSYFRDICFFITIVMALLNGFVVILHKKLIKNKYKNNTLIEHIQHSDYTNSQALHQSVCQTSSVKQSLGPTVNPIRVPVSSVAHAHACLSMCTISTTSRKRWSAVCDTYDMYVPRRYPTRRL